MRGRVLVCALMMGAHAGAFAGAESGEPLPLEGTRELAFETERATWLSLDVAPDGEELVLEILGDLYTLPITGGQARRITSGMGFDSQPVYSPGGEWIAFVSDRGGSEALWIVRPDGSEARLVSEPDPDVLLASPAWLPDGAALVVSRTSWPLRTHELWMYHVDGGKGVQITHAKSESDTPRDERSNALGAAPSPDGRYLYYARRSGGFAYNARLPMWQIARRDLIRGDEDVLTDALGSGMRPVLAPDGGRLVYATRFDGETGLRIRDLESGEERWLAYPVQRDEQESRFTRDLMPGYDFTPDGRSVVFTHDGRLERVELSTGERSVIPLRARVSQRLGPRLYFPRRIDTGPVRVRIVQTPAWSPDGRRVAFSAQTRIFVTDAVTPQPRQLTPPGLKAYQPSWSPDGRRLAFVSWEADGGHVYTLRASGSGRPRRISKFAGFYSDPVWLADGSGIAVLRSDLHDREISASIYPTYAEIVILPRGGGAPRRVLPARGAGSLHLGPERDRIYAYVRGGVDGKRPHGLFSVRLDGTDRREHLRVVGPAVYYSEDPMPAADVRISPDGRHAVALVGGQAWVLPVPRIGGEAPVVDVGDPSLPLGRLTHVGADYVRWSMDGSSVGWAIGPVIHRRELASIPLSTPAKPAEESGADAGAAAEPFAAAESDASVETLEVSLRFPRVVASGEIALVGGRVITMAPGSPVIENATVLVRDGRIVQLAPSPEVALSPTVRIVDASGATVVPGFVDTHAHYFESQRRILDPQNPALLANLAYGVTTGLDVQPGTNDVIAYQDLVDAGEAVGPRAYSTGPGIFSTNAFTSLDHAREVLRRYRDRYGVRNVKAYIVGNRRQRQWVAMAARELEMMPTTEGALSLKLDLTHALDGFSGNEHALPVVPLLDDVIQLFARGGTAYTPTLLVAYGGPWAENRFYSEHSPHDDPKLRRFLPHGYLDARALRRHWFHPQEEVYVRLAAEAAKIARAGGRVGVGGHGQLQGLGYHWELWALASGGLSPHEVLRAATLHGAEIIGLAEDLGSLEPGKLADLVVLRANPLEDIRNTREIRWVMKGGRLYDGDTLDEIWPRRQSLPPPWWRREAPGAGGPAGGSPPPVVTR